KIHPPKPNNRLQIDAPVTSSVARMMTARNSGPTWPCSNPTHNIPNWKSKRLQLWAWSSRSLQSLIQKLSQIDPVQLLQQYRSFYLKLEAKLINPKLTAPAIKPIPVQEKTWVKLEDFCRYGY